jgi:hypothetical protein
MSLRLGVARSGLGLAVGLAVAVAVAVARRAELVGQRRAAAVQAQVTAVPVAVLEEVAVQPRSQT